MMFDDYIYEPDDYIYESDGATKIALLEEENKKLKEQIEELKERMKQTKNYPQYEHHRNPSGLHNKVNYLLSESRWDLVRLNEICEEISIPVSDIKSYMSWAKAISIASAVLNGRKELFRDSKEWKWIKSYNARPEDTDASST